MATKKITDDFSATTGTKGKVGNLIKGNIETALDSDWFKFDASKFKGNISTIKFVSSDSSHILNLYDNKGHLIPNGISNGIATLMTPDVYYVAVSGAIGKYALKTAIVNDDFGSTLSTAKIVKGTSIAGKIENAGDVDTFKTALKAGNSYEFNLKKLSADKATLSLLDNKGTVIATDDNHDGKITFDAINNADYYFSVAGIGKNTGNYQVALSDKAVITTPIIPTPTIPDTAVPIPKPPKTEPVVNNTVTTYDLYANSPVSAATYVVDAATGSFKFILDMNSMSHSGAVMIKNFGADDSLSIANGWDVNFSMMRVADSGTIGQFQEHIQVTQPFSMQNMTPESMNIWLGNLPGEVGGRIQAIGSPISNINEFNALSVGDIFWS